MQLNPFERFELSPGRDLKSTPVSGYFRVSDQGIRKDTDRGAHRDLYQKTVAFESVYRDQGGRDRRVHAGLYRPAGKAALALRGLPTAMPEVHDIRKEREWRDLSMRKLPLKLRYPSAPGGVSPLRSAGGRLSVGQAVGASDHGAVQCRGRAGAGVELEGDARIRAELEERGHDCEAGRAVRAEAPETAAGTRDWHR